jgi:hypothetical protein
VYGYFTLSKIGIACDFVQSCGVVEHSSSSDSSSSSINAKDFDVGLGEADHTHLSLDKCFTISETNGP